MDSIMNQTYSGKLENQGIQGIQEKKKKANLSFLRKM